MHVRAVLSSLCTWNLADVPCRASVAIVLQFLDTNSFSQPAQTPQYSSMQWVCSGCTEFAQGLGESNRCHTCTERMLQQLRVAHAARAAAQSAIGTGSRQAAQDKKCTHTADRVLNTLLCCNVCILKKTGLLKERRLCLRFRGGSRGRTRPLRDRHLQGHCWPRLGHA